MNRPNFLDNYTFNWEVFDVIIGGKSALDSRFFITPFRTPEQIISFLKGYGVGLEDPVNKAELFGNFQEAIQFIKRYFLKEGNHDGIPLEIPQQFFLIAEISEIFQLAVKDESKSDTPERGELRLWAEVVLKVMHTILHVDKDLRSNYFPAIQTQVFDRFYKVVFTDQDKKIFLGTNKNPYQIKLCDFETKAKKKRDSVILKLLHKAENVAEELFDRIGIRFITESRFDSLRVIKFLYEQNVVIPHNVKPSRSINTIIDLKKFKDKYDSIFSMAAKGSLSEERFLLALERGAQESAIENEQVERDNPHSLHGYRSIQFTARQLIKYKNPFLEQFNSLRNSVREMDKKDQIAKQVMSLDISLISRDIRFFYPYEVQILDQSSYKTNMQGEASHEDYKKAQQQSAMKRLFSSLVKFKGISI